MGFTACTTRLVMIHHLVISSTLIECCGRLTIKVNGWHNMIVYKCFYKWIDNEIAEVFVLWREAPNYLHMLMLHCLKIANELMFWRRLLIKSKEVSISLLEICKSYLISDIIYFFLINPNIIYLAQFPHIKYQLSKFWAHIRYQISVSTPPLYASPINCSYHKILSLYVNLNA